MSTFQTNFKSIFSTQNQKKFQKNKIADTVRAELEQNVGPSFTGVNPQLKKKNHKKNNKPIVDVNKSPPATARSLYVDEMKIRKEQAVKKHPIPSPTLVSDLVLVFGGHYIFFF